MQVEEGMVAKVLKENASEFQGKQTSISRMNPEI
jgi:hypothetical protein